MKRARRLLLLLCLAVVGSMGASWIAGSILTAPRHEHVGALPGDLPGENVTIASDSGETLRGWFIPGISGRGAVMLMHGVRANRLSMLNRARLLHAAGFAVLLCDFQAHGESTGRQITFGYLESRDARSEVRWLRRRIPGEKVGLVGTSLGGAAAVLASPPLDADAMVLESVYPSIGEAVSDRLKARLGPWAGVIAPLLVMQIRPRMGIDPSVLRPVDAVAKLRVPKLFIAGTADRSTTIREAELLFHAAAEPKELWEVPGAAHQDMFEFARAEYRARVLEFLGSRLRS